VLRAAGAAPASVDRVRALVLATRHDALPADADAALLVDVDLAILGAAPARFAEYEGQVRAEYAHVPPALFARKRGEILRAFAARPAIYATPALRDELEAAARANLARAIAGLG
jgi:predicted metal-dependent HD superfamily phosphohydrolase